MTWWVSNLYRFDLFNGYALCMSWNLRSINLGTSLFPTFGTNILQTLLCYWSQPKLSRPRLVGCIFALVTSWIFVRKVLRPSITFVFGLLLCGMTAMLHARQKMGTRSGYVLIRVWAISLKYRSSATTKLGISSFICCSLSLQLLDMLLNFL